MTAATLSIISAGLCSDLETVRPLFIAVPSRGCLVCVTIQAFSDMKNDDTDGLKLPVELPMLWSIQRKPKAATVLRRFTVHTLGRV